MTKHVLVLPGDGIGPEVMRSATDILSALIEKEGLDITLDYDLVGGSAYEAYGTPLKEETLAKAKQADAVLLGAVGGPEWDNLERAKRPEAALLRLRKELGLYANLRPAFVFESLASASSLKQELVNGLDILIIRELTGGVYFGQPRGIETLANGEQRGVDTQVYTTHEIERIGRIAFESARKRNNQVTSVEKANVMESGLLWRQVITALHQRDYADVTLNHMYADNCAMQLVRYPKQFDVIVTDNLFGDILSDCAAMLTGSLGMLPSASLGMHSAMYEPVHGSAPDIAGQNKANPLATILSVAMMLRYSFSLLTSATRLEQAVITVLEKNIRTRDIADETSTIASTSDITNAILQSL